MSRDGESWYKRKMRKRERSASMEANASETDIPTNAEVKKMKSTLDDMQKAMSIWTLGVNAAKLRGEIDRLVYDLYQGHNSLDDDDETDPRHRYNRLREQYVNLVLDVGN